MNSQTTKPQPEPRFKKGGIVRYKQSFREKFLKDQIELQKKYPTIKLGNQPIHNLRIYMEPRWDSSRNTYLYDYEYGPYLTSEGVAQETDLEWGNSGQSSITIY